MESKNFDEAKKYYEENKDRLVEIINKEFPGRVDYQSEYDQVAVWFNGFSLCYQNSDMNGGDKGEPHWNNEGANGGVDELKNILKQDKRFQPLIASGEYWKNEYLNEIIADFCNDFADKNNIASYFEYNQ